MPTAKPSRSSPVQPRSRSLALDYVRDAVTKDLAILTEALRAKKPARTHAGQAAKPARGKK